jgi:hypothetical protein
MDNDDMEKYRRIRAAQQKAQTKKSQPSSGAVLSNPERSVNRIVSRGAQVVRTVPNRAARRVSGQASTYTPAIHVGAASRALPSSGRILLSILVPTVPGREAKLGALLASLDRQAEVQPDVEVLVLRDARKMVIGDKRNRMIHIARGEYVVFVDDDDEVAPDYIAAIQSALESRPDLVCFTVLVRGHGPPKPCRYHPTYAHQNLPNEYRRKPNHLMAWRREMATTVEFPSVKVGEDTAWGDAMASKAEKIVTIDRVLYTYHFDVRDNSATTR